jgi:hypothetical protein
MSLNFDSKPWDAKVEQAEAVYARPNSTDADMDKLSDARKARCRAKIACVDKQPLPFLQGLLIAVERRGADKAAGGWHRSPTLDEWYDAADGGVWDSDYAAANTPENRRVLHTLLSAMVECPRTWARSAVVRHLRAQGKQKQTKYTGNGVLGARNALAWKGDDVIGTMAVLMDTGELWDPRNVRVADALCVQCEGFDYYPSEAVWEASYKTGANPFAFNHTKRNTRLLKQLCTTLEHMGLGPALTRPSPKGPAKARKAKVFKPGDKVTKGNARDLPLGAVLDMPKGHRPYTYGARRLWLLNRQKTGGMWGCGEAATSARS